MCCNTLAYSFVDKDRLFLRPTVRGRGVNGSIEEVRTRFLSLALTQPCATSTFTISRGLSLAWYYSPPSQLQPLIYPVELDAPEPVQPLATFSRRTCKRNQLYPLTKIALPAALDREASHSCLPWRLYQRENIQALVPTHHPPRRAFTARTNGRSHVGVKQMGESTNSSRKGRKSPAQGD